VGRVNSAAGAFLIMGVLAKVRRPAATAGDYGHFAPYKMYGNDTPYEGAPWRFTRQNRCWPDGSIVDGSIVEMKIWEVPESVPGSRHRFEVQPVLWDGPGQRLHRPTTMSAGRGDHRHVEGKQQGPTLFSTPGAADRGFSWRIVRPPTR